MPAISKTADHALAVLVELCDRGPRGASELAVDTGLNRTVVHRLLATLHGRGFVRRLSDGRWDLGAILVRLGSCVQPELRAIADPAMTRLAAESGETVVLHVPDGTDAVVLDQRVPSTNVVRVEHTIGSRHSLAEGASGRALLAFLPPDTVKRVANAAADPEALEERVDDVRKLGYALSHDELQMGVHGLAAPVLRRSDGVAVASLAILVPTSRAQRLGQHVEALTGAAEELSAALVERGIGAGAPAK